MAKINEIIEQIKGLTVVEVSELVKALEEEFGVSAAAPTMVAAAPVAAAGAAAEASAGGDAKAAYNVVLKGVKPDGSKVGVIKAVKENVAADDAKEMQKKLEEAGAEIELA